MTFIMLDPVTNAPLKGSEAIRVLEEKNTLTAFQTAGLQASQFKTTGN